MWRVNYGRGRIGEWDPALKEWSRTPMFGQGAGTRVNDFQDPKFNAPITDDQWLASLLELGVVGVVALLWFFTASIRRLGRLARRDDSDDGWLLAALASALAAYAFGMLTFDAFNFVQMTMLAFLLAALGVVLLRPHAVRGAGVSTAELAPPAVAAAPARDAAAAGLRRRRRELAPARPRRGRDGLEARRPRGSARRRGWSSRSSSRGCSARPTSASRPRSSSSPPWSSSSPTWPSGPRSSSARRSPTTTAPRRSGPARPPAWPSPLLGIALAGPIADFYGEPQVKPLVMVLSATFLLTSVSTIQESLLARDLAFRTLETRLMAATVVGAVVGIGAAALGWGAWAVILQSLTLSLCSSALLWAMSPWRPQLRFSWAVAALDGVLQRLPLRPPPPLLPAPQLRQPAHRQGDRPGLAGRLRHRLQHHPRPLQPDRGPAAGRALPRLLAHPGRQGAHRRRLDPRHARGRRRCPSPPWRGWPSSPTTS